MRNAELSRLSAYECSAMACAEKLAQTSAEDERKAVLDELADMVREWDVNATSMRRCSNVPAFLEAAGALTCKNHRQIRIA